MVALSDTARTAIQRLMTDDSGAGGLRIMVEQGGCSGLQYMLSIETAAQADDEVFEFAGVRVFVDPISLPILRGMTVDFIDTVESSGFTFDNPNVGNLCSCGKSFSS